MCAAARAGAKYTMKLPISRVALAHITNRFSTDISVADTVSIPLSGSECPEEFGDELRLWCREHCRGRRKQIERGACNAVVMAFESAIDAAMFRLAAYPACRATITARHRRQRAALKS